MPLVGVLFFDWNLREILILYWAESGIIGFYTILKMFRAKTTGRIPGLSRFWYIVFFATHFSGFMTGHAMFLNFLIPSPDGTKFINPEFIFSTSFGLSFLYLFISHGFSYYSNFIGKKEYENADLEKLSMQPYPRIILMHVSIVLGSFLSVGFLKRGVGTLAVLVFLKTITDLVSHLWEREKFSKKRPEIDLGTEEQVPYGINSNFYSKSSIKLFIVVVVMCLFSIIFTTYVRKAGEVKQIYLPGRIR